ncbi:endonuclease-reverse transcriptase domain-containing protein [Hirsutella rhossiliensis]|uniref:Endonuclease-reverse transcriptase domain-containing protein n=1 Tax=Hirsutella rhossiliensis TaxID=111463 RepID=A0A9P8SKL6_9HYPO|nr:endonuclease-reverse transcriptase domain-containing protein [Hirsutella rhossiliensis]KAH0965359.1 endonuclease-reverse transcriptase domain-containing protein [Hirsutella rhossiliensis]
MGDAADETETDEPDDLPEAQGPAVTVAHAAERLIANQMEAQQAKLAVFRAFCTAFDKTAAQFNSGHALSFAKEFSRGFISYWDDALNGAPTRAGQNVNSRHGRDGTAPTYAAMAQKGMAQTRAPLPARLGPKPWKAPPVQPPKDDLRVFVRLDDKSPAWGYQGHAIRAHVAKTLNLGTERMPQIARVKTGWAIRASDREARDLLVERQDDWAARLGAVAVEGFQKWHTYAVADCPRQLTDIWGAAVDYDQAIKEEIKLQTGAEPIDVHIAKRYSESSDQPTVTMIVSFQAAIQRRWRLFGTSRLARLIAKTARPAQCDTCWDYHSRYACDRKQACRRCGGKDHRDNDCKQPERRTIRVLQANVAKIGAYHSIALRLAEAEDYDVVLIQEPNVWIEKKAEPAGPRRTAPSTHSPQNAPGNRIRPESDLQDVPERCLIAGDFNACHFSWQPGARSARNGKDIAQWAADKGLGLLTTPGEATHARGNTIDLAFANIPLLTRLSKSTFIPARTITRSALRSPADSPKDDS